MKKVDKWGGSVVEWGEEGGDWLMGMVNVNGMEENRAIGFVQGDTYEYRLVFADGELAESVERVVLTCEKLGVQKEFER